MTWSPLTTVKPDISSYCVQNLKEGTEYFFRVIAENAVGKSEPLDSDGVVPKSPYGESFLVNRGMADGEKNPIKVPKDLLKSSIFKPWGSPRNSSFLISAFQVVFNIRYSKPS